MAADTQAPSPCPAPSHPSGAQRPARGRWGGIGIGPPALRLTWAFKASFLKRGQRSGLLPEITSLLAFPLMGLTSALPPARACSRSSNAAAQAQVILDTNAEFQAVSGLPVNVPGQRGASRQVRTPPRAQTQRVCPHTQESRTIRLVSVCF